MATSSINTSSLSLSPESKNEVLMSSLNRFYAIPDNLRKLTDILKNRTKVSLRNLDWLCTNYSKKHNITYIHNGQLFNMYLDYKASLKAFSKRSFDPFQRRERITIKDADGEALTTTCAQLCFFRWAISKGVLDYAIRESSKIEADMLQSIKHRYNLNNKRAVCQPSEKPKRKELSKAATKTATKKSISVTVRFT